MARKTLTKVPAPQGKVEDVDIVGVMKESYSEYAAAVVVGRALPDVRDGLKPVHRRVLYAMRVGGYDWTAGFRKSARIVGDVMGKYHPHGDSSIYDAMARLTQPWSVTTPLVDGQGNFGSVDGDNPAAMRYTEARLSKISRFLVEEINRDTVDFRPNYDENEVEPVVLPAAFPNILVNGGSGIAVGMASSIPQHNLSEVIDATMLRLKNPDMELNAIMSAIPGPDFPTGGRILGNEGIIKAYQTGRGTLDVEAITHFEKDGRNPLIVYTDMPWGVTRPGVLKKINEMINLGNLPDVISARDETDRTGPRFVVELRAGADPDYIDRILKTQTPLRNGVSLNFTLLDGRGVPREMGLLDILDEWIDFRRITVRRRASFDLRKARDRGRLLLGRIAAHSIMDKVIKLIRASANREEASDAIMALSFAAADFEELVSLLGTKEQRKGKRFSLTREQADDILNMRLQRLTNLERKGLEEEAAKVVEQMKYLREILSNSDKLDAVIVDELEQVRALGVADRKTIIDAEAEVLRATAADTIAPLEQTTLLEMPDGTIARSKKGLPEGLVARATPTDTHAKLVFISDLGTAYGVSVDDVPALDKKEDPRSLPGLLGLSPNGQIVSTLLFSAAELAPRDEGGATLAFVTRDGMVRRTEAAEFARIPQPGKMAMKINGTDAPILSVFKQTDGKTAEGLPLGGAIFLGTSTGRVIRFSLEDVRVFNGRGSRGVRGMKLEGDDYLVAALEVPDMSLPAPLSDEIEAGWAGKAPKRGLSQEAADLINGPEVVQMASTGHMKRTIVHAYRQARRDGRGINDLGPAKTIGEIIGYALVQSTDENVRILQASDVVDVALDKIRKGTRATTGGIAAESPKGFY